MNWIILDKAALVKGKPYLCGKKDEVPFVGSWNGAHWNLCAIGAYAEDSDPDYEPTHVAELEEVNG